MALFITILIFFSLAGCSRTEGEDPEFDFLVQTEPTAYDGVEVPSARIEELRQEIADHEAEVTELVSAINRTAVLHKLLAQEFLRQQMYEPALDELESAMAIQAENAVLYYWAAVASARSAKAHYDEAGRYLDRSLDYYERAIAIRPNYKEALYGISVLLAFELNRPVEALPYISRLASLETAAVDVKFLHANILVRVERYEDALEIYDELSQSAPSETTRMRAQENRDRLLREVQR